MNLESCVNIIIEEVLRIYPDAKQLDVSFYHDEDGNGPYIDSLRIVSENETIEDYVLNNEIEEELDFIRMNDYGYYFSIDIKNGEVF